MNSLERFLAAASFSPADRIPSAPQVYGLAAVMAGVTIYQYIHCGKVMADCQWAAQQTLGYDALFVYGGNAVEAEALGCSLAYPSHYYPHIVKPVLESWQDWGKLKPVPNCQAGIFSVLQQACGILRQRAEDNIPVIGIVTGPVTLAGQILGIEKLLFTLADEPEGFLRLLKRTTEASLQFARLLLRAGAHIIMLNDPSASPNLIPKNMYAEMVLPFQQAILQELRSLKPFLLWLQIVGYTWGILPGMAQAGADLLTVDYQVDLAEARTLAPAAALAGNLKPLSFVMDGPEFIAQEIGALCKKMGHDPGKNGWILSSGCEIPPESRVENIRMLVEKPAGEKPNKPI
ncbi:uroporphyrinogen decarboxylase family protein [Sporomusa acidovorans]|uniref:Uroporphyrinogen decarboxylase n=1 Tax=Sporomusa acidovorans (strain ATCC 49682 / DSM 3132 / Mol) TaxID=1123286 RepID=A0ABZ3J9Q4_SPOA4|nr:uroporphyrinogen decarboxylase family protein [Sporomusa acidovorans]OZC21771.1 uroporphyrinogen decarboxylase [Sporomusa acidovorans DSM 3132]SDD57326.1 uroporphyrinogen decarboxylase [Sporomusa acidovorans]